MHYKFSVNCRNIHEFWGARNEIQANCEISSFYNCADEDSIQVYDALSMGNRFTLLRENVDSRLPSDAV
jgi:hypothetical protein